MLAQNTACNIKHLKIKTFTLTRPFFRAAMSLEVGKNSGIFQGLSFMHVGSAGALRA